MSDAIKLNQIQSQLDPASINKQTAKEQVQVQQKESEEKISKINTDTVELSKGQETQTGIYTVDQKEIEAIKQDFANNLNAFKEMVRSMLEKQGIKFEDVFQALKNENGELAVEVDEETQKKAQEAISEDGYWGVKKTSERILDFAKALSGGDPDKIELLRGAVEEGFKEAQKVFGDDELPEITQKTYDAIMEGFDTWANEGAQT